MNYNEELSQIQTDMLDEMPSTYSKLKGTWLWEMFKAFAIKIYEFLQLLTDTASKLNSVNLTASNSHLRCGAHLCATS